MVLAAAALTLAGCSTHSGRVAGDLGQPVTGQSAGASEATGSVAPSNPLLAKGGILSLQNRKDNEEHIDRPDELEEGTDTPHTVANDDLSRELNNPNTPLAKLSFKTTTTFFKGKAPGADSQFSNVLLFQPAFPFPLAEDGTTNLFIRPAVPFLTSVPIPNSATGRFESKTRIADIGFDIAIGQSFDSGLIAVGGIQGTLPTGHSDVSGSQLRLGPEFLGAYLNKEFVVAAFPAHQWNVAGAGPDFSTTSLELVAFKFVQGGWTVGTDSKLSYDWTTNEATIPINLTVRKLLKFGSLPVQISGEVDYFVAGPDGFRPDWAFTINITPVVPNFIYNAIKG